MGNVTAVGCGLTTEDELAVVAVEVVAADRLRGWRFVGLPLAGSAGVVGFTRLVGVEFCRIEGTGKDEAEVLEDVEADEGEGVEAAEADDALGKS